LIEGSSGYGRGEEGSMRDRDKRTLAEVHRTEPDPFTDRQNLEPEKLGEEETEENRTIEGGVEFEAETAEQSDAEYDDSDVDDSELDDGVATGRSRSDIEEYARKDTAAGPYEEEPRTHDDDDPWGDGIHDTPLVKRYEDMADRDELARRLEELVADAYDWMGRAQDEDAQEIYETLLDLAERMGNPSEETTRTEPGQPPPDRDETDA
jgi:hypothetical protein